MRLYSIASPESGEDGKGNVICTPVKRVVDEYWPPKPGKTRRRGLFMGVCSNYLCDLAVGDEVKITGPVGKRFLLPVRADGHHHVFVATGTGIAPFRGMVLELLERGKGNQDTDIWLLMGAPYTTDLLYHEQFLELARENENFHYLQALSREPRADGARGTYVDELIEMHQNRLGPVLADESTVLYLCGLLGLPFNVYRRLAKLGLLDGFTASTHRLRSGNRLIFHLDDAGVPAGVTQKIVGRHRHEPRGAVDREAVPDLHRDPLLFERGHQVQIVGLEAELVLGSDV